VIPECGTNEVDSGSSKHSRSRSSRHKSIFDLHYNYTVVIFTDREAELRDGIRMASVDTRPLLIDSLKIDPGDVPTRTAEAVGFDVEVPVADILSQ